jgi:2,4-dienoyl-CoA reductase-like NADH-dependent reductase (Old Yellow Enzyme family)
VILRLSGDDFFPGGMPFAEARQVAIWAAEAGADTIHVAGGHYRSLPSAAMMIPPMALPLFCISPRISERRSQFR